jgi:uncharacterized membrane protein (DUF485 family)
MKITKKHILSFVLLSFITLGQLSFVMHGASAQTAWEGQYGTNEIGQTFGVGDPSSVKDIRTIIIEIVNIALTMLGILFLVLIVFAGYQWMTSGGNEDSITKARKRMVNAIIGLVIVLASWTITNFIIRRALCATGTYNASLCSYFN